jgi:hypothetical protein
MSDQRELDLLVDVARLMKKHGPDAFERLAMLASSPEFPARLTAILSATARVGRQLRDKNGGGTPRGNFRASLSQETATEPEKAALLLSLYDELHAKAVLSTLRDCRAFAIQNGLPPLNATTRGKAIQELIEALVPLDQDRLQAVIGALKTGTGHEDRSLEGWTRLILDKENRTKKPAS